MTGEAFCFTHIGMMRHGILNSPLFKLKVLIFTGPMDEDYFNSVLTEIEPLHTPGDLDLGRGTAQGSTWDCGHNQIIWLATEDVSVAAHEFVHAAFHVAESIGFDDDYKSQEFHAYFVEWAMREFILWTSK